MERSFRTLWYLFVFLLTLELCLRVQAAWQWGAPIWGPYSFEMLTVNDAMGTRNRPHARFEKWRINGQGFQGPELSVPKPGGITRIGIAGASEIFGLYESPGHDVTSQVRDILDKSAPGRFEVVNIATPGMSIPRIVELHERWIRKYMFDAILYYPSPAMYLDSEPPDFRGAVIEESANKAAVTSSTWDLRFPGKTWDMLRDRLPVRIQVELKRHMIEKKRRSHTKEWVWEHDSPEERVALFGRHILNLIQSVERSGTRVILATHANRFRNNPTGEIDPHMVGWIRFYPRASSESLLDMEKKANRLIRGLGNKHRVAVVDVEVAVGKNPDRYADFVHFTDTGAALAAQAMADSMRSLYPK